MSNDGDTTEDDGFVMKVSTVPVDEVERRVGELQEQGYDVVKKRPMRGSEPRVEIKAFKRNEPTQL